MSNDNICVVVSCSKECDLSRVFLSERGMDREAICRFTTVAMFELAAVSVTQKVEVSGFD